MSLKVHIDATGWFPMDPPGARWESVTSDEMKLADMPPDPAFPLLSDLAAVRRYFQQLIRTRGGALISCDVVAAGEAAMVRTVSKYRAGRGYAMAYTASLAIPVADRAIELSISGSEDNFTGVREAMITAELCKTAGPSEQRQLAENRIPIEWKFERYEPGTQAELSYLLSDDEKYDARYPDHPLSRVRRWLRRQERGFRVEAEKDSTFSRLWHQAVPTGDQTRIEVHPLELKPMGFEEIVQELGGQVASDAIMPEVFSRMNPPLPLPALATRQKMYRDQRDAAMKNIMEKQQELNDQVAQVREDVENLLKRLTAGTARVALARDRASGGWHTIREGEAEVLAVFTSAAFVEDFIACKALNCEPVEMNVTDLFACLSKLRGEIAALEFDRCPRCADVRPVVRLSEITGDGELLKAYAIRVSTLKLHVERNIRIAAQETDTVKRMGTLRYTAEHLDPGAAGVRLELAKLAMQTGDAALLEESKRVLAKYSPADLASL